MFRLLNLLSTPMRSDHTLKSYSLLLYSLQLGEAAHVVRQFAGLGSLSHHLATDHHNPRSGHQLAPRLGVIGLSHVMCAFHNVSVISILGKGVLYTSPFCPNYYYF